MSQTSLLHSRSQPSFFLGDMLMFFLLGGATSLRIKIETWKKNLEDDHPLLPFLERYTALFFQGGEVGCSLLGRETSLRSPFVSMGVV